jgi:hypothetical protein
VRRFPLLVPITADDPDSDACEAVWDVYRRWQKPLLTLWGEELASEIIGFVRRTS